MQPISPLHRFTSFILIGIAFLSISCRENPSLSSRTTYLDEEIQSPVEEEFMEGDVLFQTSHSGQSLAILIATESEFSHCGILFKNKGKWMVYEAVEPVCITPLDDWIARGEDGKYVRKRLKNSSQTLTPEVIETMKEEATSHLGKHYDLLFKWGDDKMYCSELVWKVFNEGAGIQVGKLKKWGDYDLSHPVVAKIVKQRYPNGVPKNETVISPQGIYESEVLE